MQLFNKCLINTIFTCFIYIVFLFIFKNAYGQSVNNESINKLFNEYYTVNHAIKHPEAISTDNLLYNKNEPETILDSTIEKSVLGVQTNNYKWYYSYDINGILDFCERKYYNSQDEYEGLTEKMYYNSSGQLVLFKGLAYQEKYIYNNDLLIMKLFDDSGLSNYNDTTWYYYNEQNKLQCQISGKYPDYFVKKYTYIDTDSAFITLYYNFLFTGSPILDSLPESSSNYKLYTRKFNNQGQIKELSCKHINTNLMIERDEFEMFFSYNDNNQLVYTSFFSIPNGIFKLTETIRFYYTYNDEGNIVQFVKKRFNSESSIWDLENQKDYYYSPIYMNLNYNKTSDFHIYPNPADNIIYIKGMNVNNLNYSIYNMLGQKVSQGIISHQKINLTNIPAGIYGVSIILNGVKHSGKLLKN